MGKFLKPRSKKLKTQKDSKFARLSLFFFDRPRLTAMLWVELILVGILSFAVLLPREGFPPVQFPIGVASGTYFVDDASKVDADVTQKIGQATQDIEGIDQVDTTASDNFFSVVASYSSDQTSESGNEILKKAIESAGLPAEAKVEYTVINPSQFLNQYDSLVSVYAKDGMSAAQLEEISEQVSGKLAGYDGITKAEVVSQFDTAVNPFSGQEETIQSSFGGVALKEDGQNLDIFRANTIGVVKSEEIDILELSESVNKAIAEINADPAYEEVGIVVGADFAESINTQIDSLAENLITAIVAVAIISFLLISWRVSLITAMIIVTVILTSMFVMFLTGITINTISLFGLVLALGLFVDDATIIAEAIDATKSKKKKAREIVKEAITKVGAASFAGSFTTILMFVPLVFVSGILGEFIRILPITVIIALVSSFVLSVSLIPFISKYLMLSDKSLQAKPKQTIINRAEHKIGSGIASFIGIAKRGRKTALALSLTMVFVSFIFLAAGGAIGSKVKFNIFPANKDTDQLSLIINFPPQTSIEQAEASAVEATTIVKDVLGENVEKMSIGANQAATSRSADVLIELKPYTDREAKSPELTEQITQALSDFEGGETRVVQLDAGPPADQYPFKVQVYNEDRQAALEKAYEIDEFLQGKSATRPNGTTANITTTKVSYVEDIARRDGSMFVQVEAGYDDTDTSALVVATQQDVEEEFGTDGIEFDFGFESDSQESFSSLPFVGMIALLVMFVLLAVQFKSLVQPLLIFLAIPFSFFGVMLGLYLTDNPVSFFVMVGFFGLIGISVNNTILVTDYANQERAKGSRIIDSAALAVQKRFRPLITTTITTVVALLPLALSDPFWESLAFTIIFGLISSTVLVIVCFPFYYILVEGVRAKAKNKWRSVRSK